MKEQQRTTDGGGIARLWEAMMSAHTGEAGGRARAFAVFAAAFLLGGAPFPFSTRPLGVAFLCAATDSLPFAAAGFVLRGLLDGEGLWLYVAVCAATLTVRLLARVFVDLPARLLERFDLRTALSHLGGRIFAESLYLRMTSACVSVFFMSLVSIVQGGFRYYDLFGALLAMAVAPLAVFLFSGFFADDGTLSPRVRAFLRHAWRVALLCGICLGLCPIARWMAMTLAAYALLSVSKKSGFAAAAITAVLCGASMGIPLLPALLAAAVACALLSHLPPALGAAGATAAGTLAGAASAMSIPMLFFSLLAGGVLYCGAAHLGENILLLPDEEKTPPPPAPPRGDGLSLALTELQGAYEGLAQMCYGMARQSRHAEGDPSDREGAQMFADNYAAMASVMRDVACAAREGEEENEEAARALRERLSVLGFSALAASVRGGRGRRVCVTLPAPAPEEGRAAYLMGQIESCLGFPLLEDAPLVERDICHLSFREAPVYAAEIGAANAAAEGICGDAHTHFRTADARMGVLLADGMGQGKSAAFTARTAVSFLKKLLLASVRPEQALPMLGAFLRLGCNTGDKENSCTTDLLMLDGYSGHGVVYKCGAAPTYIKRGESIFKLAAGTMPLGILAETDIGRMEFDFADGDILLMVSDGVAGDEESVWLLEYLTETTETDPQAIATHIVTEAARRGGPDDMTAILLAIHKKV